MALELYSNKLVLYSQQVTNSDLLTSLRQLQIFLHGQNIILRECAAEIIAVPFTIPVTLPPLGNSENIDIRAEENVLFVFDIKN